MTAFRKQLINDLVRDVHNDARDNGASLVYDFYVREYFNSLSDAELEDQHEAAGLNEVDE